MIMSTCSGISSRARREAAAFVVRTPKPIRRIRLPSSIVGSTSPPSTYSVIREVERPPETEPFERPAGNIGFPGAAGQAEAGRNVKIGRPWQGDAAVAHEHQVRIES